MAPPLDLVVHKRNRTFVHKVAPYLTLGEGLNVVAWCNLGGQQDEDHADWDPAPLGAKLDCPLCLGAIARRENERQKKLERAKKKGVRTEW